ncbi:MAG: hypothetical protein HUU06_07670 [Planctomycetaceae bacterium]|nr:hypothetical protein [Planctomycetota bacterium]NUN52649.1 hypothetical protein [Planctomycetaceae bacterium]
MAKDEIVDADGGPPPADAFLTGLVIFTTIALLAGFFIIKYAHGHVYAEGFLKP